MFGDILQPTHLLFILVVALLVLGPKRLPEVGRSLGKGMRDFKNAISQDNPVTDALMFHEEDHEVDQPVSHPTTSHVPAPAKPTATTTEPAPEAAVAHSAPGHASAGKSNSGETSHA